MLEAVPEHCLYTMQEIRKLIMSAILATDMSFHFSLTTEFKNHAGMNPYLTLQNPMNSNGPARRPAIYSGSNAANICLLHTSGFVMLHSSMTLWACP